MRMDLSPPEQAHAEKFWSLPGNHIDIGTADGGSASLAAAAKKGLGTVFTVDPRNLADGMPGSEAREWLDKNPTAKIVFVKAHSHTLPREWYQATEATTGFIDGDHKLPIVEMDFGNLAAIPTMRHITFHDCDHLDILTYINGPRVQEWGKAVEWAAPEGAKLKICTVVRHVTS